MSANALPSTSDPQLAAWEDRDACQVKLNCYYILKIKKKKENENKRHKNNDLSNLLLVYGQTSAL